MDTKKILFTGASGLLGHYLLPMFDRAETVTLHRGGEADIKCDLTAETPQFNGVFPQGIDLVVHAAGTNDEQQAIVLNLQGTERLLNGLAEVPVKQFVYISSTDVYGKKEGEDINEESRLRTINKSGQSKVLAEEKIRKFCDEKGIILTVLRPVAMFGKGMKGWSAQMAAQVLTGYYFNIRDNDAKVSIVLAYDVARVVKELAPIGGTYNVTDLRHHSLRELAMAMGNNGGKAKKPFFLPMKWAKLFAFIGNKVPFVGWLLNSEKLARRTTNLTFSGARLHETLPEFIFHDTAAVVGRTDKDFPYEDD